MPYFTLQMTAQGPMLSALIGVSQARAGALKAQNQEAPALVQVRALVDTGATGTCVDPSVLLGLGLSPRGVVAVSTPSTGSVPEMKDQYDITLVVPGANPTNSPLVVANLPVVGAELLQAQGFHALLGRDVLSICLMTYDGANGFFSLAY